MNRATIRTAAHPALPRGTSRLRVLFLLLMIPLTSQAANWIRPGINTNQPIWGLRNGLQWAIYPGGFRSGEPRGLIRLGYPVLKESGYDLINFIAIEPIVKGSRSFSELEQSQADRVQGKRIWAENPSQTNTPPSSSVPGDVSKRAPGIEQLTVLLRIERFENGAHVKLIARQCTDRPDELDLQVFTEPGSAPLEYCILTATMGNKTRTRLLWLKDGPASSLKLYPDHRNNEFAPHTIFTLEQLLHTPDGGPLVAVTNDEQDPAAASLPRHSFWRYEGIPVTQYWRKAPGTFQPDLHVAVNARYTYWMSSRPIPGGIAFENFELRERFHEGQTFTFGITAKPPKELGFRGNSSDQGALKR